MPDKVKAHRQDGRGRRDEAAATAVKIGQGAQQAVGSQTEAALDMLRSRIIDLTLEPAGRIDEPMLIKLFRLGRTPAREAINRLVAEGFVKIMPNRGGMFVRKLDFAEIGEIVVAQQLAESVLGELCNLNDPGMVDELEAMQVGYEQHVHARRYLMITSVNEAFHLRMYRSIGNSLIYEFAESTNRHVRRLLVYMYRLEAAVPDRQDAMFAQNLEEHRRILNALRRKDRPLLRSLLPDHARATQRRLVHILQSSTVPELNLDIAPMP